MHSFDSEGQKVSDEGILALFSPFEISPFLHLHFSGWLGCSQSYFAVIFQWLYALYFLQASSKDTEYLYAAIHHRLVAQRSFAEQELDANQVDTEPETAFHSLNCDSDDDDDEEDETITQVSSNESGK